MTDFHRTTDDGPEGSDLEDDRERPDSETLAKAASLAFARYMARKNRRGLVCCPVCMGTGDGPAFLSSCGACDGNGCVLPEVAAEIRGAA